jgi:hypothetical protein
MLGVVAAMAMWRTLRPIAAVRTAFARVQA